MMYIFSLKIILFLYKIKIKNSFSQVYYSLVADKNNAYLKFRIDQQTGLITTNTTFDREEENVYFITVMAKDGINSDIPYHEPPNSPNSGK